MTAIRAVLGVREGRVRLADGLGGRWVGLRAPVDAKGAPDPSWRDLGVHAVPPIDGAGALLHLFLAEDAEADTPIEEVLGDWAAGRVLLLPPLPAVLQALARGEVPPPPKVDGTALWEVVPNLYRADFRTPTLPPATTTNSYLVGSREALLVEPATPSKAEQDRMVAWVEESGLEIVALLPTHHHVDHVGAVEALKARLGVPLWGHAATAARLPQHTFDRTLEDGETLFLDGPEPVTMQVLLTPGHAPGHLCLRDTASGAIIAGDMIASVGTILVEPRDGNMTLYLQSLERLRALEPSLLLPAHGLPIRDADGVLARYIDHRLAREAKVADALEAHGGPAKASDLVPTAYADAPRAVWPLAAMSTEAHLLKLVEDGRATLRNGTYAPAVIGIGRRG